MHAKMNVIAKISVDTLIAVSLH